MMPTDRESVILEREREGGENKRPSASSKEKGAMSDEPFEVVIELCSDPLISQMAEFPK